MIVAMFRAMVSSVVALMLSQSALAGIEVTALGHRYAPPEGRVPIFQAEADKGGSTSIRNTDRAHLEWKTQGYYQRNRDLGQVFTPDDDFRLDAIVLRTGPSDKAVLAGAPGAEVFIQFFEVEGDPIINDNGTPPGVDATHGFSKNHRCDDFIEGVIYRPLHIARGGTFPQIPPTTDAEGQPTGDDTGCLHYLRWDLTGEDELVFQKEKRYAFMIGFVESGPERGVTLANSNSAGVAAPPKMNDAHDRYPGGWGLRREGNGTLPPTMTGEPTPPTDPGLLRKMFDESLFAEGDDRFALSPTTDGYPDVDTYRDLEFYLEVHPSR